MNRSNIYSEQDILQQLQQGNFNNLGQIMEGYQQGEFQFLLYVPKKLLQNQNFWSKFRQHLNTNDEVPLYQATTQEKRRYDHWSYDYVYEKWQYYLTPENTLRKDCIERTYSDTYED